MKNTESPMLTTVAKDQTIEDIVKESPVDQHELKVRKRLGIMALIIILLLLFLC